MKIKDQDRLMCAVKVVLDAEDALAAVLTAPKSKPKKVIEERRYQRADAENKLCRARVALREMYTEVYKASRE